MNISEKCVGARARAPKASSIVTDGHVGCLTANRGIAALLPTIKPLLHGRHAKSASTNVRKDPLSGIIVSFGCGGGALCVGLERNELSLYRRAQLHIEIAALGW